MSKEYLATKTDLEGLSKDFSTEISTLDGNLTNVKNNLSTEISTLDGNLTNVKNNLQNQINNIVIETSESGDVTAEVVQARVNASGTTYATLKTRLDAMDAISNDLKNNLYQYSSRLFTDESLWNNSNVWTEEGSPITRSDSTTVISLKPVQLLSDNPHIITGLSINVSDGYLYSFSWADSEITCIATSGWVKGLKRFKIPDNAIYFAIKLKRIDKKNISVSECSNIVITNGYGDDNINVVLEQHSDELAQFISPHSSVFNEEDFCIGGRAIYGGDPTSTTTRVTNKVSGMTFSPVDAIIIPDSSVKHFIYNEDNTMINWNNAPFKTLGGKKYDYICAYADDRTIEDISDLLSHFKIFTPIGAKANEINNTIEIVKNLPYLTEYRGKRISILGDSISTFEGYSYDGNRCRYPQDNLLTDVNDTYWMRLINEFQMALGINESWAGSRVSWDGITESQDIGPDKHIASATRIGHLGEHGTPDIILVNAGTNDIGASVTIGTFNSENPMNYTDEEITKLPVATFADAYRTMLIRLQKAYPTSKLIVLLPNYTTSYYTPANADKYCEIIKEACDYFGIKWVDMRASGITIFNRATYLPDGIHYNAKGMEVIEKNIKKFFLYNFTV